jgi:hypothetical protein
VTVSCQLQMVCRGMRFSGDKGIGASLYLWYLFVAYEIIVDLIHGCD